MFTMKYDPKQWMMTVRFNTGGTIRSDWENFDPIHVEKYGPFDTKEDAWMLYYTLKAEDEYGNIRQHPYFEEIAAPPALSVAQKFAAAKHVMRNPELEYWKPSLRHPFPVETKEQLMHRVDISNYILESAAVEMVDEIDAYQPVYYGGGCFHHPVCGCNTCYVRHFNQWSPN